MLSKIALVYRTVINLKWVQIRYQIWYRLKNKFIKINNFKDFVSLNLYPLNSSIVDVLYKSSGRVKDSQEFTFLNLNHRFVPGGINWKFENYGKLWNYNLQYFDYLHDSDISDSFKIYLIEDCCDWLLDNRLVLEPYPVSLRIVNWILYFSETDYKSEKFQYALKLQIAYLRKNLEYHIQANHLLENYISLCIAALALKDNGLFLFSYDSIKKQLKEQILDDGGHYECTPMYQSIILSKLLLLYSIILNNNIFNSDIALLKNYISKMLGWLNKFSFENSSIANFNDSINYIAPSLQTIRESARLLGIKDDPVSLKESGYRKMKTESFELIVDAGNIMPTYQPGHAHSDMLSFCLQFEAEDIIVDFGISTYQPNKQRELERSTFAHNTVTINDENQSEVWGSFRVGKRAILKIEADENDFLIASHNGYLKKYGISHKRTFRASNNSIEITDELLGKENITTDKTARLYLAPNLMPSINSFNQTILLNNGVLISCIGAEKIEIKSYMQPIAYNLFKESQMISIKFLSFLKTTIEKS